MGLLPILGLPKILFQGEGSFVGFLGCFLLPPQLNVCSRVPCTLMGMTPLLTAV